jgi:hypothetical protein
MLSIIAYNLGVMQSYNHAYGCMPHRMSSNRASSYEMWVLPRVSEFLTVRSITSNKLSVLQSRLIDVGGNTLQPMRSTLIEVPDGHKRRYCILGRFRAYEVLITSAGLYQN